MRTTLSTLRRAPVAAAALVAATTLLVAGCGEDVVDDGVEQELEDAGEDLEDAGEDVGDAVEDEATDG
ncbi:hypothetical protein [Aquipuribacter nitratireducens]|uniref:Lipoprotein n=1 Tax=Aquipuribacter nitratireducens TaxID=650104 RepID=A0ABW0GP20_9MICO